MCSNLLYTMKYKQMLGKLMGSNARVKILKQFISHPDDKFYIRQLSRDLKLQLNSVRRELENLEMFGFLTSNPEISSNSTGENNNAAVSESIKAVKDKSRSDRKYYVVNKNFVLFDEIKSLIIKAQVLYERDFIEKIQKTGVVKLLVLAGFFVNEDEKPIDLFIVGRFHKPKLMKAIKELENELGREVNYTVMDIKEFKYRRDITDVFLYNILEGKKYVVLDELGIS